MDQYKLLGLALVAIAVYDIYILFRLPKAGKMVLAVLFAAFALASLLLGGALLSGRLPMA
jgi:hypothetical protein